MAFAVHLVNTPLAGVRDVYLRAWTEINARGLRHPEGRQCHLSWVTDDVLHVVDVWDSEAHLGAFMRDLEPILREFGTTVRDNPETGEFVQLVLPES